MFFYIYTNFGKLHNLLACQLLFSASCAKFFMDVSLSAFYNSKILFRYIYIQDKKRAKETDWRREGTRAELNIGKIAEIGKTKSLRSIGVILCLFGSNKLFSTKRIRHLGHLAQKSLASLHPAVRTITVKIS